MMFPLDTVRMTGVACLRSKPSDSLWFVILAVISSSVSSDIVLDEISSGGP